MLQSTSRILRLEPASQPQNLRAEPQKFERATARSTKTIFHRKPISKHNTDNAKVDFHWNHINVRDAPVD